MLIPTASKVPTEKNTESNLEKGTQFLTASKIPPDLLEGPSQRMMWKFLRGRFDSAESHVSDSARMAKLAI